MEKQQEFFHQKSGIIFNWQGKSNSYEPIARDGKMLENGEIDAIEIKEGDVYYTFIMYVRYSSMIVNKKTGAVIPGALDVYQWDIAFKLMKAALALNAEDTMCAISRQAGKSYLSRKTLAFLIIFAPYYLGERLVEDRYYATFAGVKKDLVFDHCKKMEADLDKAIELFNKLHPDGQIITATENKELSNQVMKKQYNRQVNGTEVTYSAFDGLSLSANVNAG